MVPGLDGESLAPDELVTEGMDHEGAVVPGHVAPRSVL